MRLRRTLLIAVEATLDEHERLDEKVPEALREYAHAVEVGLLGWTDAEARNMGDCRIKTLHYVDEVEE